MVCLFSQGRTRDNRVTDPILLQTLIDTRWLDWLALVKSVLVCLLGVACRMPEVTTGQTRNPVYRF